MGLKLVEMQVALPRTMDAGKLSEQMQQRGKVISDQAADEMTKTSKHAEQSVVEMERKEETQLKEDPSRRHHSRHGKNGKKKQPNSPNGNEVHPYKGTSIDYNG